MGADLCQSVHRETGQILRVQSKWALVLFQIQDSPIPYLEINPLEAYEIFLSLLPMHCIYLCACTECLYKHITYIMIKSSGFFI